MEASFIVARPWAGRTFQDGIDSGRKFASGPPSRGSVFLNQNAPAWFRTWAIGKRRYSKGRFMRAGASLRSVMFGSPGDPPRTDRPLPSPAPGRHHSAADGLCQGHGPPRRAPRLHGPVRRFDGKAVCQGVKQFSELSLYPPAGSVGYRPCTSSSRKIQREVTTGAGPSRTVPSIVHLYPRCK